MKKIPTMFVRDWSGDRSRVVDVPHPDCGWVFAGEGWPTIKFDGTCCMVRAGVLFRRRELKSGQRAPFGFESEGTDPETGKTVGWVPVGDGPEDRWHREAFDWLDPKEDGTYELIGPHIQGNPESNHREELVNHQDGDWVIRERVPRDFDGLRVWLSGRDIEGIVWHHADGRMAKIKLRDFGLKRGSA